MNVVGLDVVAQNDNFDSVADHVELRPWQWELLHAFDGRTELRAVAAHCGIELADALAAVEEAQAAGLVHVVTLSLAGYRSWNAAPLEIAADVPFDRVATNDDHLSTTSVPASYDYAIPTWMTEPHEAADQHEAGDAHTDESVEEPLAAQIHEPVAEYHAEPVAEYHAEPVAEYHAEPVAEYHAEPVADYHAEPVAEYHAEPVAEYHAEPVADAEPVAEYHAEPVAEYHAEPEVASSNGHSVAWESSSFDAVDGRHAAHDESGFRDSDVPEGISIWLSHNSPVAEPQPESHEKGSVSLSFSLDDMPEVLSNADVPFVPAHSEHAAAPVAEYANPSPSIEPKPEQPAARESTMPENPPAGVYSSNGTSKPRVNGTPAPAPAPAPSSTSATADIVGSLISRALTFRIK
jgi:hypothetical protein